jgi:AraC-like DNA-binding protein
VCPSRMGRLHHADPTCFRWVSAESWAQAVEVIRANPVEMAVVDPLLGDKPRPHGIVRLQALFPSLPLMIYTELSPATAAALLRLGRAGIERAVFQRFEDSPRALRAAIAAELEHSATRAVVQAVQGAFGTLPPGIADALSTMLHDPAAASTVAGLAERADHSRRTCERLFTKFGLPPPKAVMILTRLLYAHRLLLDPGHTVEDVALKLGYGKVKTLQRHLRAVFGMSAGDLRVSMSLEEAPAIAAGRVDVLHVGGRGVRSSSASEPLQPLS